MVQVTVRVHPGSRQEQVKLHDEGSLEVWIRARAVNGQANRAVVRALADRLGLRGSAVRIARGERTRLKVLEIDLESFEAVRARLSDQL